MIVMVVVVMVSLGPCFIIAATADKQTDKSLCLPLFSGRECRQCSLLLLLSTLCVLGHCLAISMCVLTSFAAGGNSWSRLVCRLCLPEPPFEVFVAYA